MTSPYDLYETDKNLEAGEGVELEYPGFSITVHRAGGSNKKYQQVMAAKLKPHRSKHERGLMDEELSNKLIVEAYAEAVIIGWKGVKGKDGKKLPFTKENCVKLFMDLPDLFTDVYEQANNVSTFKAEVEAVEAKN